MTFNSHLNIQRLVKTCPIKRASGWLGFVTIYKHFSGFGFFLHVKQKPRRPSAMLRERKPLGALGRIANTMKRKRVIYPRTEIELEKLNTKQLLARLKHLQ